MKPGIKKYKQLIHTDFFFMDFLIPGFIMTV
jgi:hypothetical protein